MAWDVDHLPDLSDKVALVTGANSGIGEPTAQALGAAGAHVYIACRSPEKAHAAIARMQQAVPEGQFHFLPLDLADLASVKVCAERFKERHDRLDLLINNAGVMIPPYTQTNDGFELQFGTNHLGHFALTAHLIDVVTSTPNSRVVTVSSMAHRFGRLRFGDLQRTRGYNRWLTYGQSKVANLIFSYELQRRLTAAHHTTLAIAAHPGWAQTRLTKYSLSAAFFAPLLAQGPKAGAAPTIRAATDPEATAGSYYGPRWLEIRGPAVRVGSTLYSHREDVAQQLWGVSESLTGLRYLS
jgi:NAD(P)-dependent dehydrogenase (short-subunit alcohol dehydrogenase family)